MIFPAGFLIAFAWGKLGGKVTKSRHVTAGQYSLIKYEPVAKHSDCDQVTAGVYVCVMARTMIISLLFQHPYIFKKIAEHMVSKQELSVMSITSCCVPVMI